MAEWFKPNMSAKRNSRYSDVQPRLFADIRYESVKSSSLRRPVSKNTSYKSARVKKQRYSSMDPYVDSFATDFQSPPSILKSKSSKRDTSGSTKQALVPALPESFVTMVSECEAIKRKNSSIRYNSPI